MRRFLQSIRPLALGVGFGGALFGLLVALALVFGLGREVTLITPHDASCVIVNKALYSPGDSVAEIYGVPTKETVKIISPDKDLLIRPDEDPTLLLMKVDKQGGENPLQARTVWFFAKRVLPPLLLVGIVGLFLPRKRPRSYDVLRTNAGSTQITTRASGNLS